MKCTFKFFQIILLICGVISVDPEVKSVSVMEGDSVTLNTDVPETQGVILILWRFGDKGSTIAQIDGKDISYPSHIDIFRGRLQLDPTGSLTINNMRTKHSGLYKLQIDFKSLPTSRITFNVTVYESPSVFGAGEAEVKSLTVMEGGSVTLQIDVTLLHRDELIVWRFGDEGKLLAKSDIEANIKLLYDAADERFKGRLDLDQTGFLTITNTRTTDSGEYKVKISSNKQMLYKRFSVTVIDSGLSPGLIVLIVFAVLLYLLIPLSCLGCYHRYMGERKKVSVTEGEDAILRTDVTELHKDDTIQWWYEDTDDLIAEIKGGITKTHDVSDDRFGDRLSLDNFGILTIRNSKTIHSGLYKLKISSNTWTRCIKTRSKRFLLTVNIKTLKMNVGGAQTIPSGVALQTGDMILWKFGTNGSLIAKIDEKKKFFGGPDGRFSGRLELDDTTGSLTITNITTEDTGLYKLQIINSSGTTNKRLRLTVTGAAVTNEARTKSLMKEKNENRDNKLAVEMVPLNQADSK